MALRRQLAPAFCLFRKIITSEAASSVGGLFHVRPAWASTWRWESSRELVIASEANRRASFREAGVKEAGSKTAGRRTGTG